MSPRLHFAIETAIRAGKSTLAYFQVGTAVDLKADDSPVTAADRGAERLIREAIAREYPGEGIMGEEEGEVGAQDARWVVDPIDGTKSFISGVPLFGTLLAYEVDRVAKVGVCFFPALNELVYAEQGQGTFWNGRQCRVSEKRTLKGAVVASGSMASMARLGRLDGMQRIESLALASRTWGDAYGHALVATGRVEAMIDPIIAHWDISAMSIIVREAGGSFTDFKGSNDLAAEALSSNGHVHQELMEAFAG